MIQKPAKRPLTPRRVRTAIRGALVCVLFSVLAGLWGSGGKLPKYRIFIVDVSYSMGVHWRDFWARVSPFLRRNILSLGKRDRAGLFLFGRGFQKVFGLKERDECPKEFYPVPEGEIRTATELKEVLKGIQGRIPSGFQGELVVVSDGRATSGDPREAVSSFGGREVLHTCLFHTPDWIEGWLEGFRFPSRAEEGELFSLSVTAGFSGLPGGKLRVALFREGEEKPVGSEDFFLRDGEKRRISFQDRSEKEGLCRYWVKLTALGFPDTFVENNRMYALVPVGERRAILYLRGAGLENEFLQQLEKIAGTTVEVLPAELPGDESLLIYDALILDNVPSSRLGRDGERRIEQYVRNGGGFFMLGGKRAFGPGGFKGSFVEKLLPLSCEPGDQIPKDVMLLLDRSGSMSEEGKWEAACKAALELFQKMRPSDRLHLIPFSDAPGALGGSWKPGIPGEGLRLQKALEGLRPFGGTALLKALSHAVHSIQTGKGRSARVFLVSDGKAGDGTLQEFTSIAMEFGNRKIPLSVIATGKDIEREILLVLSSRTGGSFSLLEDPNQLMDTLWEEFSSDLIQDRSSNVERVSDGEILRGTGLMERPPPGVNGWVRTGRKKEGQMLFATEGGDPILAVGRYGRGRTAALTTYPGPPWGEGWILERPLWERLIKWLMGPQRTSPLDVRSEYGETGLTVEAWARDRSAWGWDLLAEVAGTERTFPMREVRPGFYQGKTSAVERGGAFIRIFRKGEKEAVAETSVSIPCSGEFYPGPPDRALLADLAAMGRGFFLPGAEEEIPGIQTNEDGREEPVLPLILAVFLFVLDQVVPVFLPGRDRSV